MFNFYKFSSAAIIAIIALLLSVTYYITNNYKSNLPVVAIAYLGPHSSLHESIKGIKEELERYGFKENQNIRYEIVNVNFEPSLIPQMLAKLHALRPKVMVVTNTPVAQAAKNMIKDIPLVFNVITDPVAAGLIKFRNQPSKNITGSSDKQDLASMLEFARSIIPNAKRVGILYSTSEDNDIALVKMLNEAADKHNIQVIAVPIEQPRDIPIRMMEFKGKIDFLYVGASGPVQSSLPAIVSAAEGMKLPVFNVNAEEVVEHKVLASFGVSYYKIGASTGAIVAKILNGERPKNIPPAYPLYEDYQAVVSQRRANAIGLSIPKHIKLLTVVE